MYGIVALVLSIVDAHGVAPARCQDPGPDAPVTLSVQATRMNFQGFPVIYTMPVDPVGVVFYFQGAGDLENEVFANEQTAMLWNLYVSEGFGIVATERTAPGGKSSWDNWSAWNRNQDAQRLDDLRNELIRTTPLAADTPVLLTGFSDGSAMALTFSRMAASHGWPVFAVSSHNSTRSDAPAVPTIFLLGEHDLDSVLDGLPRITNQLDQAGTLYQVIHIAERLVTPEVFLREPGWNQAKAQDMFDDMVAHGLIDRNGRRLVADSRMNGALKDWQRTSNQRGVSLAVARVRIVWALHRYNAFAAVEECNFVLDALP